MADAFAKLERQRFTVTEVHIHRDDWMALQADPEIVTEMTLWGSKIVFDDTLVGEAQVVGKGGQTVQVRFESA